jgi:hypothetical protein
MTDDSLPVVKVLTGSGRYERARLLYERGESCRVRMEDGRERTVLASRVKRTSKLAASALLTMANKAAEVGAGAEAYLAIAKGDLSAAIPFLEAMREADGATDDPVTHARLHAEVFPESPALRSVFADSPTLRAVPKPPKPMRSNAYLAFVRQRACMCCLADGPSDAHHFGPRGMGEKTDDYRTVPLCASCHRHFHDHGTLPGRERHVTEQRFALSMRGLLLEWIDQLEGSTFIVDALVEALRGER